MQSILLISHGGMAAGVKDSLTMFFGTELNQFETLSLKSDMGADEFGDQLRKKVDELMNEDGVIIFADLLGGTPFNQAALLVSDKVDLIAGMNLPMIMEFLATREYSVNDIDHLAAVGQQGIVNAKVLLAAADDTEDDD
ncbi:MAG: PTS sugar transporter subunit IIA [Erysipelotrichaceae bacterium]|nr:PTS sugar transporter subunit IIA [Erysipelotrichaceae bacterium]